MFNNQCLLCTFLKTFEDQSSLVLVPLHLAYVEVCLYVGRQEEAEIRNEFEFTSKNLQHFFALVFDYATLVVVQLHDDVE